MVLQLIYIDFAYWIFEILPKIFDDDFTFVWCKLFDKYYLLG